MRGLPVQLFALSVAEMGRLVALERDQREEFFHDPFMNDSRLALGVPVHE